MYILNINGLTEHLSNNKPTSREALQYVLGWVVLSLMVQISSLFESKKAPSENIFMILGVGIIGMGIGYLIFRAYANALYSRNGGDLGEYFLDRAVAIIFVASCRCSIICYPISLIFLILLRTSVIQGGGILAGALMMIILGMAVLIYNVIVSLEAMQKVGDRWREKRLAEATL